MKATFQPTVYLGAFLQASQKIPYSLRFAVNGILWEPVAVVASEWDFNYTWKPFPLGFALKKVGFTGRHLSSFFSFFFSSLSVSGSNVFSELDKCSLDCIFSFLGGGRGGWGEKGLTSESNEFRLHTRLEAPIQMEFH